MKLAPDTVDAAGRHAIGVSLTTNDGDTTTEWTFDSTTYDDRGFREHINFEGPIQINSLAVTKVAVVDLVREVPK